MCVHVAWCARMRVKACAEPGRLLVEVCWRNAETAAPFYCLLLQSVFLSSQGMQGWNTQRCERGKNSQKMTLKALFLCQILLRTHTINTFFADFARFILKGPPYLFSISLPLQSQSPAHSCMQIHAHTNTLMRPFTHQLCYSLLLYEAITQLPPLWQSSQITSIWIPPLPSPLYLLPFLAHPCSIWPPSPLSLWLRSHSVIIQHRATKKKKNPGISIHTLRRSINLQCTFSMATVVLFLARMPTCGHKRWSVSVWSVCKTNRWHHGRRAPPALLV